MIVVGIVGASFCGSTVIGRMLSSLPGVIYPGELHWLLDPHDIPVCYVCGHNCPIFNTELERRVTPENIYDEVASAMGGCDVLVSGDKSISHYVRYTRQPDIIILLTRDPMTHVASLAREFESEIEAAKAWSAWTKETFEFLEENRPFSTLHMTLEGFLVNPQQHVDWIRELSFQKIPKGKVFLPERRHNCGGNRFGASSLRIDRTRPGKRRIEKEDEVMEIIKEASDLVRRPEFNSIRLEL